MALWQAVSLSMGMMVGVSPFLTIPTFVAWDRLRPAAS